MWKPGDGTWICECYNEWCSNRKWGMWDEKPSDPQHCPVCGWPAGYGCGIIYCPDFVDTDWDEAIRENERRGNEQEAFCRR